MDGLHAFQLFMASKDIGWEVNPGNMPKVNRPVGIRKSGCDQILHITSNKGIYIGVYSTK
jgi:hypothetical protein